MDRRHHSIELTGSPAAAAAAAVAGPSSGAAELGMSTELYLAVYKGRKEEAVALLLQQHGGSAAADDDDDDQVAGIHQVCAERNTVLHLAAEHGHDELIQELYASFGGNALLSSRNSALDTPLHCAARAGHHRAVSLLVQQLTWDYGDDRSVMGCKNEAGDTALHLAARLGHGASVEALVSAAPEVAAEVNDAGVSPLYLAVMSRSVPAVRAITARCSDASTAGPSSQNALHAAVFRGSEMVSLLLDWRPSLASEIDGSGSSPLHYASSDGDRSIVSAILRAAPPCTVRAQDKDGLSALHVAAGMGHAGAVKELMKACPDAAKLRDYRGGTFLHSAARGGHAKVVSLAVKRAAAPRGGLPDAQDRDGNTPLHLAVDARACDVVQALVTAGKARTDVMNRDGHTPLDLVAKSTGFFPTINLVVTLTAFGAQSHPERQDRVERWSCRGIANGIEKTSDSLAVVAVLVATVAFSAAYNVPGSYGDDGMAALQRNRFFKWFLVLDGVAMIFSVAAVTFIVCGKASRSDGSSRWTFVAALHCMWVSLVTMILAFYTALVAVATTRAVTEITYVVIYGGFTFLVVGINKLITPAISTSTICKFLWRSYPQGKHAVIRRHVSRRYPVADGFVPNLLLFMFISLYGLVGLLTISTQGRGAFVTPVPAPAPAPR